MIFTLPTWPSSRRTLIPWGCVADFVRISRTTPSVSRPVLWSCFNTMETFNPGRMSARFIPSFIYNSIYGIDDQYARSNPNHEDMFFFTILVRLKTRDCISRKPLDKTVPISLIVTPCDINSYNLTERLHYV